MEMDSNSQISSDRKPSSSTDDGTKQKAQTESAESEPKASSSLPEEGGAFECNICFEPAKDAVVTMCGHLFCWPCLSRWLEARGANAVCPVCKSAISRERCVPIYGRNADAQRDPRSSAGTSGASETSSETPRRPQGQREEPAQNANPFFFGTPFNFFPDTAGGNGFNLSFGIGAFPFALFSTFNLGGMANQGGARRAEVNADGQPLENDLLVSRAFLCLAVLFFVWLVLL